MERPPPSNMRILSAAIAPLARKTSIVIANAVAMVPTAVPRRRSNTSITITATLQILLWCSIAAAGIAVYIFMQQLADATIVPTCVLMCVAPLVSIIYLLLHCAVSKRFARETSLEDGAVDHTTISHSTIRLSVAVAILWMLTAGWNLVMVVRQVTCPFEQSRETLWRSQATCIAHRIGASITVLAFIDSMCLFTILAQAHQPFEAHLFGAHVSEGESETLLPPNPSKYSIKRRSYSTSTTTLCEDPKCLCPPRRNSRSLFMFHSTSNTNLQLQPAPPQHGAHGLGIYAPLPRSPSPPKRASRPYRTLAPRSQFAPRSTSPTESDKSSSYSQLSALPPPQYPSSLHVPLHLGTVKLQRRASSSSSEKD